jgi:predicted nucleic acid-binding protein
VSFLIDTCTLAELVKPRPHFGVLAWFEAQDADALHLSALTVGEIEKGVALLPSGRRRTGLRTWLGTLASTYASRVLPVDAAVAALWGRLSAAAEQGSRLVSVVDGLIAATALHHGLTVVTRNTKDFIPSGVPLLDPWQA